VSVKDATIPRIAVRAPGPLCAGRGQDVTSFFHTLFPGRHPSLSFAPTGISGRNRILLHNRIAGVATMAFGIIPECRPASLGNEGSALSESPVDQVQAPSQPRVQIHHRGTCLSYFTKCRYDLTFCSSFSVLLSIRHDSCPHSLSFQW